MRDLRLLASILVLAFAGCATPVSQTYRSTYQLTETGDSESRMLTNLAELGVQELVGEGFEYRLGERFIRTDTELDPENGPDSDNVSILNQPSADLRTTFGTITWQQGYEALDNRQKSDVAPDNDSLRTDILQRIDWNPEPGLPQVSAWIDYRTVEDDLFFDQTNTETVFEVTQEFGVFEYDYTFQYEELNDDATDLDRDRYEHIFRGTYDQEHMEGELTTTFSLFVDERTTTTETSVAGGGTIQVFPLAGLSVVDTTPQIAILDNNPLLIDADDATSAGINIGGFAGGGQLDWNMGVELLPGSDIEEIRLFTETVVDPLFRNDFSFSVWSSDDNNFWTLVTSTANYVYEDVFRRFRITIPKVSSRYLKIVNTASPAAAPAVFVTELQVFERLGGGGTSDFDLEDSIYNLTGNVSWRPTSDLTLTWDLFTQTFKTDADGTDTRDEVRIENGLAALWTPHPQWDFSVRAEDRRKQDDVQPDEDFVYLSGFTTYRPIDTLDFTVNYTHTDRNLDNEDDLATDSAQLTTSAQLLETLSIDLSAEINNQDDDRNNREIDRTIFTGTLYAALTPELDMTLALRNENGDVSGRGAGGFPDPDEDRYEIVLLYSPSDQLTAEVQLEYVDTFAGEGLDQRYQLDWVPFRDGSVDVQLDYDRQDTGSVGDETVDRYRALVRWTMNPSAFLETSYGAEIPEDSDRTDILRFSLNVSL